MCAHAGGAAACRRRAGASAWHEGHPPTGRVGFQVEYVCDARVAEPVQLHVRVEALAFRARERPTADRVHKVAARDEVA